MLTENCGDPAMAAENEGAVVIGRPARLIVAYWWPGDMAPEGALLKSPHIATPA